MSVLMAWPLLVLYVKAFEAEDSLPLTDRALIDEINSLGGWVASDYFTSDLTQADINNLVATIEEDETDVHEDDWGALEDRIEIPASFDSRQQWPSCIHPVRDQGQCGSCWAISATEVLSDRYCIEKGIEVVLSTQWVVSCDRRNLGCSGGYLNRAWTFLRREGSVADSCMSYVSGTSGDESSCPSACDDGTPLQLYTASQVKKYQGQRKMQLALMQAGPIQTSFAVHHDFLQYRSGIYTHVGGDFLGYHAVKVIGWGQEDGESYWIIANSWGINWGEMGYFRIAFGQVGIDRRGIAGRAYKVVV